MKRTLTTRAFFAAALLAPAAANADIVCQNRTTVLAKLASDYAEAPVAIGMAANGGVLEVLAAEADNRTFTIILTMPNGMSCLVASGRHFEMLSAPALAKGDPT